MDSELVYVLFCIGMSILAFLIGYFFKALREGKDYAKGYAEGYKDGGEEMMSKAPIIKTVSPEYVRFSSRMRISTEEVYGYDTNDKVENDVIEYFSREFAKHIPDFIEVKRKHTPDGFMIYTGTMFMGKGGIYD